MNHHLEPNSRGLNQSFVLEKENQLILWNFPPVSENPESGPVPEYKGSGGVCLLSWLLCSRNFLPSREALPHLECFTGKASWLVLPPSLGDHESFPGCLQNQPMGGAT